MEEYVHLSLDSYNKLMKDNRITEAFSINTKYYDKNEEEIESFFVKEYKKKERILEIDINELSQIFDFDKAVIKNIGNKVVEWEKIETKTF